MVSTRVHERTRFTRTFDNQQQTRSVAQGDSDMEDYGFEYSDDDFAEADVDIENQYYNSKGTVCIPGHVGMMIRKVAVHFVSLTLHFGWGFVAQV
jgi:hypothetical protein